MEEKVDELNELDRFLVNNIDEMVEKDIEDRRLVSEEIRKVIGTLGTFIILLKIG